MNSGETSSEPGKQEQPSGFTGFSAYSQPGGYASPGVPGHGEVPPPDYKGWAITTLVLGVLFNYFGLACGGVALRYSRQVTRRWSAGDGAGALTASKRAKGWAIAATVLDVLGFFLVVIVLLGKH